MTNTRSATCLSCFLIIIMALSILSHETNFFLFEQTQENENVYKTIESVRCMEDLSWSWLIQNILKCQMKLRVTGRKVSAKGRNFSVSLLFQKKINPLVKYKIEHLLIETFSSLASTLLQIRFASNGNDGIFPITSE